MSESFLRMTQFRHRDHGVRPLPTSSSSSTIMSAPDNPDDSRPVDWTTVGNPDWLALLICGLADLACSRVPEPPSLFLTPTPHSTTSCSNAMLPLWTTWRASLCTRNNSRPSLSPANLQA